MTLATAAQTGQDAQMQAMPRPPATGGATPGICSLCEQAQLFHPADGAARDGYACSACGATLRDRDQAQVILALLGRGQHLSRQSLVQAIRGAGKDIAILEMAYSSAFSASLGLLPGYHQAYHWADHRQSGKIGARDVPFGDLQSLDFPDNSFDLVLTSDVLPFVQDDNRAQQEVLRTLRPGGAHIAAIPMDWPFPPTTRQHYDTRGNTPTPLAEERFFRSPDGAKLPLMRRYGLDLKPQLEAMGYAVWLRRSSFLDALGRRNVTLLAVKAQAA